MFINKNAPIYAYKPDVLKIIAHAGKYLYGAGGKEFSFTVAHILLAVQRNAVS